MSSVNSLENHFLVAMPRLTGTYFGSTVTYLWKHDQSGAIGLVVNKPLKTSVADIFDELEITSGAGDRDFGARHVLAGGPVERDKGFILHDAGNKWDSSIRITPELTITTSKSILQDIASGEGPCNYLIALGCAGWGPGQLEKEMLENSWLTTPASSELIFSEDYAGKPRAAAAQLGISLEKISPSAGHS
ncbi:MAG: YqgE/AlgH family protein [Gammaproteobacteria bacterium]|nr:YqgE/AlgH family protein [Gammaproteobacteria bacterium]MCY4183444.1 YqgE/AlgH family protein [Gammaproteobacteria bacterium]MCY4270120.1 YqgE/AlgH family protein [Gammaproteobacteria bacterium]MCY4296606.1 YqgE/AlgH family protein [Gammaproteobacteria bacterium]